MDSKITKTSPDSTRWTLGTVLFLGAVFSLGAAALFDNLGLVGERFKPLPFACAVVFLKLGLFSFWPVISRKGREASTLVQALSGGKEGFAGLIEAAESLLLVEENRKKARPKDLALWSHDDPRLDLALFAANVPTMVLNHEQRILDWNPAFDLVFGHSPTLCRGAHISIWFDHLDNFRRLSKRAQKLYGEGILPLADRERATYIHPRYGRMVFTKIMNPVIERSNGKVIGWTVVLNVNSVNKRAEFLEELYAAISKDTRAVRHASSFDGLFGNYRPLKSLMAEHVKAIGTARHVLDMAAGTGLTTRWLLSKGYKVTAVEKDVHRLRRLKLNGERYMHALKIVRQDPDALKNVPASRYDAAVIVFGMHRMDDPLACLKGLHAMLKPGAVLSVSAILPSGGLEPLFQHLRSDLEEQDLYENLKHQFDAVYEHEAEDLRSRGYSFLTREDLRALMLEAGFSIDSETKGYLDGHTIHLVGRKS